MTFYPPGLAAPAEKAFGVFLNEILVFCLQILEKKLVIFREFVFLVLVGLGSCFWSNPYCFWGCQVASKGVVLG